MLDEAAGLVKEMLSKSTDAPDVPYRPFMMYIFILDNFCNLGDVEAAFIGLGWHPRGSNIRLARRFETAT